MYRGFVANGIIFEKTRFEPGCTEEVTWHTALGNGGYMKINPL
jgi:hypothetical protein